MDETNVRSSSYTANAPRTKKIFGLSRPKRETSTPQLGVEPFVWRNALRYEFLRFFKRQEALCCLLKSQVKIFGYCMPPIFKVTSASYQSDTTQAKQSPQSGSHVCYTDVCTAFAVAKKAAQNWPHNLVPRHFHRVAHQQRTHPFGSQVSSTYDHTHHQAKEIAPSCTNHRFILPGKLDKGTLTKPYPKKQSVSMTDHMR